jgi:hypothetical protein
MIADPTLYAIEHGEVYAFAARRIKRPDIPRVAAGGYTILGRRSADLLRDGWCQSYC